MDWIFVVLGAAIGLAIIAIAWVIATRRDEK